MKLTDQEADAILGVMTGFWGDDLTINGLASMFEFLSAADGLNDNGKLLRRRFVEEMIRQQWGDKSGTVQVGQALV